MLMKNNIMLVASMPIMYIYIYIHVLGISVYSTAPTRLCLKIYGCHTDQFLIWCQSYQTCRCYLVYMLSIYIYIYQIISTSFTRQTRNLLKSPDRSDVWMLSQTIQATSKGSLGGFLISRIKWCGCYPLRQWISSIQKLRFAIESHSKLQKSRALKTLASW